MVQNRISTCESELRWAGGSQSEHKCYLFAKNNRLSFCSRLLFTSNLAISMVFTMLASFKSEVEIDPKNRPKTRPKIIDASRARQKDWRSKFPERRIRARWDVIANWYFLYSLLLYNLKCHVFFGSECHAHLMAYISIFCGNYLFFHTFQLNLNFSGLDAHNSERSGYAARTRQSPNFSASVRFGLGTGSGGRMFGLGSHCDLGLKLIFFSNSNCQSILEAKQLRQHTAFWQSQHNNIEINGKSHLILRLSIGCIKFHNYRHRHTDLLRIKFTCSAQYFALLTAISFKI